ncbi:uncharacterized protein BDR25DRAFT_353069 [Lindgomyces ingoldianus]|uniref:Uncharacterized protein n=1 Tax=Lindgomyces ingoldianus TaxID=673940 RepID=A0ACB6R339_9PLEO|nr:uncharacterized protein BDR25DRAFT_353069 [Lindgomyces ingoldianus]KAF2472745.1 hypothetical protein BDR25DRAFT_353069 [Lindgomyces ingoldianus]
MLNSGRTNTPIRSNGEIFHVANCLHSHIYDWSRFVLAIAISTSFPEVAFFRSKRRVHIRIHSQASEPYGQTCRGGNILTISFHLVIALTQIIITIWRRGLTTGLARHEGPHGVITYESPSPAGGCFDEVFFDTSMTLECLHIKIQLFKKAMHWELCAYVGRQIPGRYLDIVKWCLRVNPRSDGKSLTHHAFHLPRLCRITNTSAYDSKLNPISQNMTLNLPYPKLSHRSPVKKDRDILHSASRPQRHSNWEPQTLDWRWRHGVIRSEDFEDDRRSMSVWDQMAEYTIKRRNEVRRRRRVRRERDMGRFVGVNDVDEEEEEEEEKGDRNTMEEKMLDEGHEMIEVGEKDAEAEETPTPSTPRTRAPQKSELVQMATYKIHVPMTEDGPEEVWKQTSLTAILRLTCKSPPSFTPPYTPKHKIRCPPFHRPFIDETRPTNLLKITQSLRAPPKQDDPPIPPIPHSFHWFPDAIPVDAIFPPGVPMSGKEILAFYPHHPRNRGVGLRLLENDYRGADILAISSWFRGITELPMRPMDMNDNLRTIGRSHYRDQKWSLFRHKGKSWRNMYTDDLAHSEVARKRGLSVPTFEELLTGLKYLPHGLDARGLTAVLTWYVQHRGLFSPRLEFNVLHARDLIRVLRIPLKPFGRRNLDKIGLTEWRMNGGFEEREIEVEGLRSWGGEEGKGNVAEYLSLRLVLLGPWLSWVGSGRKALGEYLDGKEREMEGYGGIMTPFSFFDAGKNV